jgi:hypothetical protein
LIFEILTPPPNLDISAPFVISGIFNKIMYPFDFFMTHTKSQLPTRRNHLIMVSQSQHCLKPNAPVVGLFYEQDYQSVSPAALCM